LLELQAGDMVFREDDEVNCFLYLLKGTVRESSTLSSGVCWSAADHTKWYGDHLLHQVRRSIWRHRCLRVCVGRYRLLLQIFGPGMQEDGRNDKSVECVTNVLMIAIHRHSLYSHFKDWLEEDNEKDEATLRERSINAAHSFKVGSALWRPGMGLAVVDNVDVTKFPYEFWVSFRDGQTSAFLPDAMFTLFKKLPADCLRGDDVEQHRRVRMSMLMMHTHVKSHGDKEPPPSEMSDAVESQNKVADSTLRKLTELSETVATVKNLFEGFRSQPSGSHLSDQARTVTCLPGPCPVSSELQWPI
jgi:hypothetical protein